MELLRTTLDGDSLALFGLQTLWTFLKNVLIERRARRMRRSFVAIGFLVALLVGGAAAHGQSSGDDEVLTNESIVKLVQSGIESNLIVKMIEEQATNFRLGSTNVIQLKQKGVPPSVISAMLSKKTAAGKPAGDPGAPSAGVSTKKDGAKSLTPNYAWSKVEKKDPITNKETFAVVLDTPAIAEDGGTRQGTFEVTATCDTAATTLRVLFASDATPGIGLKQNSETYFVGGGLAGALTMAKHHQKSWTVTRVRIGESSGREITSENDYKNTADVYFTTPRPSTPAANQDEAGMQALMQFASFLGPNKPAGETEELFLAKTLLLEMELENGVKTLLTVRPQDEVFQGFAERCRKLEPERLTIGNVGTKGEIRPPDRSSAAYSGGNKGNVLPGNVPVTSVAARRFVIPGGAQFTMTVQEALDLNGVRAHQMVHAVLTQPMTAGEQSGGSGQSTYVPLGIGTDIFLRCTAAAGMGDVLNVRLELDHAVVGGTLIPLRSGVQTRQTSRGLSVPSRAINVRGFGGVRLPQSHTPPDPVVVPAKEQLSFSTSQITYAPPGFKP